MALVCPLLSQAKIILVHQNLLDREQELISFSAALTISAGSSSVPGIDNFTLRCLS